jgi:hypothetical protein
MHRDDRLGMAALRKSLEHGVRCRALRRWPASRALLQWTRPCCRLDSGIPSTVNGMAESQTGARESHISNDF